MKSINLVLALLVTLFSFSQNNFMPLDSGTVWTTQSYYINSGGAIMDGGWAKNSTDSIFNDTLINSNSYTQLFNYIGYLIKQKGS